MISVFHIQIIFGILIVGVIIYYYLTLENKHKEWEKENKKSWPMGVTETMIEWAEPFLIICVLVFIAFFLITSMSENKNTPIYNQQNTRPVYRNTRPYRQTTRSTYNRY